MGIPSRSILRLERSRTSFDSILVSSLTVRDMMVVSTSFTSRTPLTTPSLHGKATSSSLVRKSHGSVCPRARVSSCPSLRREIVVVLLLWLIRFCPSALRYDSQLRESSNALGDMQGLESLKMEWSLGM